MPNLEEITVSIDDGVYVAGITDYNSLTSKPSINGFVLSGNKLSSDLGIQASLEFLTDEEIDEMTDIAHGGGSDDPGLPDE